MHNVIKHEGLKQINTSILLNKILEKQPISRKDLSLETGLTSASVSRIIGELINRGFVHEIGVDNLVKRHGGPYPILLSISDGPPFIISVNIGIATIFVGLVDLGSRVLDHLSVQFEKSWDGNKLISSIIECIKLLEMRNKISFDKNVLGIGIGVGGFVDSEKGLIISHNSLKSFLIKDAVQQHLNKPIFIDNTIRSMALAEALFGKGKNLNSFAFIYVGNIISSAIVINGEVIRGWRKLTGQIGHNIVDPSGPVCMCGKRGCLEAVASDISILDRAKKIYLENRSPLLSSLVKETAQLNREIIIKAARDGDHECRKLLERRGFYIGQAISNVVNLYDPQMIIMTCNIGTLESDFELEAMQQAYNQHVFLKQTSPPIIRIVNKQGESFLKGAAALAILHLFSPQYIGKII